MPIADSAASSDSPEALGHSKFGADPSLQDRNGHTAAEVL
jgi:hypothetical protein